MKHFRTLFALIAMVGLFETIASAQTSQKADKIVQQSKAKFEGIKDFKATFTYTLSNPNLKKPIVKEGTVTFKKDKYKVIFRDEEIYCNAKYVWLKLNEDEEIVKSDVTDESLSVDKIYKIYENDTRSRYDGEEGNAHHITLFADNDKTDVWKTEVWVDKSSKMVQKFKMYARNGSEYTYEMKNIDTNTGVTDDVFNLNEAKYEAEDWIITDQTDG